MLIMYISLVSVRQNISPIYRMRFSRNVDLLKLFVVAVIV